ncbi:glycosyltransferase [Polaromonas sp.]|uniref:glycosyltransferase n=1 Tax=Polaromonas sp. TaxID=1869339 RepID=UPI00286B1F03|nr:glycosyltransferase [Polaromonas sp.]
MTSGQRSHSAPASDANPTRNLPGTGRHSGGLVLYAPNVHTGGGFVLLQTILADWPTGTEKTAFLDARGRDRLVLPDGVHVSWVAATVGSRLAAEVRLRRVARRGDTVLCFHGLPPLLPGFARVFVFLQNRLYIENTLQAKFGWKTRLRLTLERLVARTFRRRVSEYIVQTPSMRCNLQQWYSALEGGVAPRVRVLPFMDAMSLSASNAGAQQEWDFVYVADGEAHKNHRNLLQAWQLLAQDNLKPSLALTLSSRDAGLKQEVALATEQIGRHIRDLGQMPRAEVLGLYANARALIFPSTSESFGLPLIEASYLGLPIIASELDYVRDVCVPADTFDPHSPVSIARAVKRFLGCPEPTVILRTPAEFWAELLQDECA